MKANILRNRILAVIGILSLCVLIGYAAVGDVTINAVTGEVNATTVNAPIGRTATYTVCASNSVHKAQCDYVCDGVDDQVQIKQAVELGAGEVVLMDGVFSLSSRLYILNANNVTLRGLGADTILQIIDNVSTTLSHNVASGQAVVRVSDTTGFLVGQDVYIEDDTNIAHVGTRCVADDGESLVILSIEAGTPGSLTMTTDLTNSYTTGETIWTIFDGIYVEDSDNFRLLNLIVDGNQGNQKRCGCDLFQNLVRFNTCDNIEVAGCVIKEGVNNHLMLHPGASRYASLHDNRIYVNYPTNGECRGITLEAGSHYAWISNNLINSSVASPNNDMDGIYTVAIEHLLISSNIIEGVRSGMYLYRGKENLILGNRIFNVDHNGIALEAQTGGCIVQGNFIQNPGTRGIYTSGFANSLISDNYLMLSSTPGEGMWLRDGASFNSENNTVTGNYIAGSSLTYGIRQGASADNNLIYGNYIVGATTPISVTGADTKIHYNIGYVTENSGNTNKANTNTIAHGLDCTPVYVGVTSSDADHIAAVTAKGATTFTLGLKTHAGAAVTTPETVYWYAEC